MRAWRKLGTWIGSHMPLIVPFCLLGGIFLPGVFSRLRPLVTPMFALMTFQNALGNDFRSLGQVLRRPLPMLVSLAVTHVAMPVVAFAVGTALFGGAPDLVCGIVLEYSVPVAVVSVMWTSLFEGSVPLALATLFVSTMLAPFSVPLTLRLLMGASVQMDAWGMMRDMAVRVAVPALVGTALNDRTEGWAGRELSPALAPLCRIFLVLIITTNATGISGYMRGLTPQLVGVIVVIGTLAVTGFLLCIGVARLLRQPRGDGLAMAFCAGLRNISLGAVIASTYFPADTLFPVMMGTLFQQYLAAGFGRLTPLLLGTAEDDAPQA